MENQSIPPNGSTLSHTSSYTQSPHYWKTTTIALLIAFVVGAMIWIFKSQIQSPWIASVSIEITPTLTRSPLQPTKSVPPFDGTMELYRLEKMNNWKTFEDNNVGISFKYPPEWGEPKIINRKGGDSGNLYRINFPNSSFGVGGDSFDFEEGRSGSAFDFNGFGKKVTSNLFWQSAEALCRETDLVDCKIQSNQVHIITGPQCGPTFFDSYNRIMFLDRPGKLISGLAFGGSFLSSTDERSIPDGCNKSKEQEVKTFYQHILTRNLDANSLDNLDTFDAVFKTIEEI